MKLNLPALGTDVLKYGPPFVAVVTAVENTPGLHVPAEAQVIIGGLIAVGTAAISAVKQLEAKAKAKP